MTRIASTLPTVRQINGFLGHFVETLGSIARRTHATPRSETGLELLERENARIRLTSRHWLVG